MDKSTSNSESSGDISLGCGPSTSSAATTTASPSQTSDLGNGAPQVVTLNITTTTGGNFTVTVDLLQSVENLKKVIAKKLKVAKDRICLLHRERELQDGSLKDNGLMEGSKIVLIPNVETGLLAQRPENTVMQALESLNDSQVNDFLSGKTPLNLSMRLGDHMMLIQLQLSTVNPASPSHSGSSRSRSSQRSSHRSSTAGVGGGTMQSSSTSLNAGSSSHHHHHSHSTASRKIDVDAVSNSSRTNRHSSSSLNLESNSRLNASTSSAFSTAASLHNSNQNSDLNSLPPKYDFETLQNIVKSLSLAQSSLLKGNTSSASSNTVTSNDDSGISAGSVAASSIPSTSLSTSHFHADTLLEEQSPIKSLSNLVSSPIKTTSIKNIPIHHLSNSSSPSTSGSTSCSDPISAKLTSCLCKRLNTSTSSKSCDINSCQSRSAATDIIASSEFATEKAMVTSTPKLQSATSSLLHKTANNPIYRPKHRHYHHSHAHSSAIPSTSAGVVRKLQQAVSAAAGSSDKIRLIANDSGISLSTSSASTSANSNMSTETGTATPTAGATTIDLDESVTGITVSDTRALAEASRNLTQTLRKLSKEVFTNKMDLSTAEETTPRKSTGSGAVIESMKNHGKGIYSGTFSGTLNPALQDRYGRPKRDISTVIHILNDLLSATPQYSRGARISFEAPSTSAVTGLSSASRGRKQSSSSIVRRHSSVHPHTCVESSCKCASKSSLNNSTCTYGECSGHYQPSTSTNVSKSCSQCPLTLSSSASSSTAVCGDLNRINTANLDDRNSCTCRFQPIDENGDRDMCHKCSSEMENNKTKCKLDQLRLVMQQRKEKREARKLKGAPYGARVVSTPGPVAGTSATTSEVNPNQHTLVEEVDTAA